MKPENFNILIIEDDIIVALDIKSQLIELGYQVKGICDNLLDTGSVFKNHGIDLVLCDIYLDNHVIGPEIVSYLRKNYHFLVIYLSGCSDEQTISHIAKTPSNNFLVKPFTKQQLLISVKFALMNYKRIDWGEYKEPSSRELEIIKLLSKGNSTKQIADELSISFNTVEKHRKNLLSKYNFSNTAQLIAQSIMQGWITPL